MSRSLGLLGLAVFIASVVFRSAHAQDVTAVDVVGAPSRHHVFAGVSMLHNSTSFESGPGAMAELGYDYALTPSSRVGLVADGAVDFSGYGADADAITWTELGARYTHLFRFLAVPRIVPFLSGGVAVGRQGGELTTTGTFASLMFDAGVELVIFRALALDVRFTERPARMSLPPGSSFHNAAGVVADLAVVF